MTASKATTAKITGRALCAMVVASNSGENGWRQREPSQGDARRSPPKGFDLRRLRRKPKADVDSAAPPSPIEEKEKTTTQQRRDALRTQQRRESGRVSLGGVDHDAALRLPRGGSGYSMHNRRRLYGSYSAILRCSRRCNRRRMRSMRSQRVSGCCRFVPRRTCGSFCRTSVVCSHRRDDFVYRVRSI